MPRIVLDKTMMSKMMTQLNKPVNKPLFQLAKECRRTEGGNGATVFWNPPRDLVAGMHLVLSRELSWARKPDGCSAKNMAQTVAILKHHLKENFGEDIEVTQAEQLAKEKRPEIKPDATA